VVSLWKGNLHKNKNYVNNPQTVFQKYSNVIEILQFFDFGQQSFFQFYINLSNRYFMVHSNVWKFEKIWLSGTLIIIRKPKVWRMDGHEDP
jgi:hypothetical protein